MVRFLETIFNTISWFYHNHLESTHVGIVKKFYGAAFDRRRKQSKLHCTTKLQNSIKRLIFFNEIYLTRLLLIQKLISGQNDDVKWFNINWVSVGEEKIIHFFYFFPNKFALNAAQLRQHVVLFKSVKHYHKKTQEVMKTRHERKLAEKFGEYFLNILLNYYLLITFFFCKMGNNFVKSMYIKKKVGGFFCKQKVPPKSADAATLLSRLFSFKVSRTALCTRNYSH